jgi:hypothetical protein
MTGLLEVWAEYEPPTLVEPSGRSAPRFVHTIAADEESVATTRAASCHLNTDPWIFHPGFVWTICRHGELDADEEPPSDDIVLFGSVVGGEWVLDTILVVERRIRAPEPGVLGPAYSHLVWPTVRAACRPPMPFVGRPYRSMDEPFSFAPVAPEGRLFKRPGVSSLFTRLRKASNGEHPSRISARALVRCKPDTRDFWRRLRDLVFEHNLLLGVAFHHPLDATVSGGSGPSP